MLITWSDRYSIGVPAMDEQHRRLVDILNSLHDAMLKGKDREVLGPVLSSLIRYTKAHFASEEQLMQASGYAGLAAHQQEHRKMTRKVEEFEADFAQGRLALSVEVVGFLRDWLLNHILKRDRDYAAAVTAPH